MRKSSPLLILLSCMALVVLPSTAEAQSPLYLQFRSFDTNAPGYGYELGYYLGGYQQYGNYVFYADFTIGPVTLTDTSLAVTFFGNDGSVTSFSQNTGPGGAEGTPVMLRVPFYSGYHIPPGTGGVFDVKFKIYFADGTYLEDYRLVHL